MTDLQHIPEDELMALAQQWRREALRGSKDARGTAHFYESELRRRRKSEAGVLTDAALDTRSLAPRVESRPWWRRW